MQNQMMNAVFFFALLVSCNHSEIKAPKGELCIIGDGLMLCQDDRKNPPEYDIPITPNYLCTNPDDFKAQKNHLIEISKRLKVLERRCGNEN